MRIRLNQFWRYSLISGICLLCFQSYSQQDSVKSDTSTTYSPFLDLAPAQSIYGRSWDHSNVDLPKYDHEQMKLGYYLNLVDSSCGYVHPIKGVINSKYGWRRSRWHKGIDIDLEIGDPVYAAFDGVVRIQRYNRGGFGNYVMIRHYNGVETLYGHLSKSLVKINQSVRAGDIIGYGGSTGRSSGPHLHFEVRLMGQAFDPARIIDFKTYQLKDTQIYVNHTWFPYIKNGNPKNQVYPAYAKRYHKIRSGDTLFGLSLKYGTSVNTICRMNGIRRTTVLRIGRTLRVK
ncbi:MAG: peptidoglycan DD-metalloendopeptidase family protein [Bacteroidia bacterium]|nr:peptidoglycan DD-metalloendopeptidase family protein [Bacteroidia bacterium]